MSVANLSYSNIRLYFNRVSEPLSTEYLDYITLLRIPHFCSFCSLLCAYSCQNFHSLHGRKRIPKTPEADCRRTLLLHSHAPGVCIPFLRRCAFFCRFLTLLRVERLHDQESICDIVLTNCYRRFRPGTAWSRLPATMIYHSCHR